MLCDQGVSPPTHAWEGRGLCCCRQSEELALWRRRRSGPSRSRCHNPRVSVTFRTTAWRRKLVRITKENFNSHLVSKDGIRKILSPAYLGAKEYEDTGRTGGKKTKKQNKNKKTQSHHLGVYRERRYSSQPVEKR